MSKVVLCFKVGLCLLLVLGSAGSLYADSTVYDLSGVIIDGNRRIDTEAIKLQLKHSSGKVGTEQITEDIKNLYKTGFFDQVTAHVLKTQERKPRTMLKYVVIEKPIVRKVYIQGNEEVDEDDLSEIFSFGAMRFLDRAKANAMVNTAVSFYQSKGYYDASFDYSIVPVGDNQVDVTFLVEEGEEYTIEEVVLRGIETLDDEEILDFVQTQRYRWWSSWLFSTGRVNAEVLENDRQMIRQYMLDHGLIDGSVSEGLVEKKEDGLYVYFDVEEGPQFHIGEISVAGDLIEESEDKTLEDIKSEKEELFSATAIREDAFLISDKFTDIGYAYANVVPDTYIDREQNIVNVNFVVDKGKLVRVNRINIKGNNKTYDHVIRRELKIHEQETFSGSKVRRSQKLLERIGYFEEVNISTEASDKDDEIDLNVNVREGSTGTFSAGAGYSSSDGALFNSSLSENNIFGTGKKVVVRADLGTERENLVLSYQDRRYNDTYLSLGADVLRTEREFSDFDRELIGGSLSVGYPLEYIFGEWAEDISVSLKYEYLDIEISEVDPLDAAQLVIDSEGTSSSSGITPRIVRNTINNPLNPSSGSRQSLSVEFTGLGGNEEYYLIDARNKWYYPLVEGEWGKLVFSWRTRFGFGETYDNGTFPLFRRFFPGGINSVRGFKNRTLGPKDDNGNEYGGSKQFVNNLELIFPIINSAGLKGVVFYDIGEAFDDDESIHFGDLREAYGYGLRWTSPLGPIRIEFGFPIDKEEGERSMVTLFSFGAPL